MGEKLFEACWVALVIVGVTVLAYDTKMEFELAAARDAATTRVAAATQK